MGSNENGKREEAAAMEGIASIALLPSGSISGHFIHLPNSTCYGLHGTANPHDDFCEDFDGTTPAKTLRATNPLDEDSSTSSLLLTGSGGEFSCRLFDQQQRRKIPLKQRLRPATVNSPPIWASLDMNLNPSRELSCERECSRGEDYRLIKLSIIDYSRKKEQVVVVECRGHDAARFQNVDHVHGWEEDVIGMVQEIKHGNQDISVSFVCETLKSDSAAEEHLKKYMPNLAGVDAVVNIGKMSISGINFEADDEASGERAED